LAARASSLGRESLPVGDAELKTLFFDAASGEWPALWRKRKL
jgi:hypothetical protein